MKKLSLGDGELKVAAFGDGIRVGGSSPRAEAAQPLRCGHSNCVQVHGAEL